MSASEVRPETARSRLIDSAMACSSWESEGERRLERRRVAKLSVRERSAWEGLVGERRRETSSVSRSKVLGSSMAKGDGKGRARVWWEGKEKGFGSLVGLVERDSVCDCVGTVFRICGFVLFLCDFEFRLVYMFRPFCVIWEGKQNIFEKEGRNH